MSTPKWERRDAGGMPRWVAEGHGQITAVAGGLMVQIYEKVWRVADTEDELELVAALCFERMSWRDYRATLATLRAAWAVVDGLRRQAA